MTKDDFPPFDPPPAKDTNLEQTVADLERIFEEAKADRNGKDLAFKKASARYRMGLVARKKAGEKLTVQDMDAMEILAIDDVIEVRDAYLASVAADSHYRDAKVKFEEAKRNYWDQKDVDRRDIYSTSHYRNRERDE